MVKLITQGIDISDYRPDDSDDELDIKLRFQRGQRNLDRLEELRIPTSNGNYVPLSVFAELVPQQKGGISNAKMASAFMRLTLMWKRVFCLPKCLMSCKG